MTNEIQLSETDGKNVGKRTKAEELYHTLTLSLLMSYTYVYMELLVKPEI
jgi:hypothetical protein